MPAVRRLEVASTAFSPALRVSLRCRGIIILIRSDSQLQGSAVDDSKAISDTSSYRLLSIASPIPSASQMSSAGGPYMNYPYQTIMRPGIDQGMQGLPMSGRNSPAVGPFGSSMSQSNQGNSMSHQSGMSNVSSRSLIILPDEDNMEPATEADENEVYVEWTKLDISNMKIVVLSPQIVVRCLFRTITFTYSNSSLILNFRGSSPLLSVCVSDPPLSCPLLSAPSPCPYFSFPFPLVLFIHNN